MNSFQCCFCGNSINEQKSERIILHFTLRTDETQELYTHAFCFRRYLHPSVPLLLESEINVRVPLLNEGTDVWRPVRAIPCGDDIYLLSPDQQIPCDEEWQFVPGQVVRCKQRQFSGGKLALEAVELLEKRPNQGI